MSKDLFTHLILKSFQNDLTPDERRQLEAWMNESEANRKVVERLRTAWDKADAYKQDFEVDLDAGWRSVQSRISAAGTAAQQQENVRRMVPLWRMPAVRIAASLLLLIGLGWAAVTYFGIPGGQPQYTEVSTGADHVLEHRLPDGSTVWLNAGSRLRYIEDFSVRNVELTGEAEFEVDHQPESPFTVSAGGTRTTVLGTVFNVSAADRDSLVSVSLIRGSVSFSGTGDDEAVILSPGETAVYDAVQGTISKAATSTPNFNAWKTGELVFENADIESVLADLEDYFDMEIELDNRSESPCRFTGTFLVPTFDEVIDVLSFTYDMDQSKVNGHPALIINQCD